MADKLPLWQLTALDARRQIAEGLISSETLIDACLERIAETDGSIGAWAHVDAGGARDQAREMDTIRRRGRALGSLHGVPVGLKDIFDVAGLPSGCGTPIRDGQIAKADCAVAEGLREAGAVILGKTVSTEYAFVNPAATRNPHDGERTPGGSSAGSAAAVAAGQVPLAIGSQTNGSTIRPASFCGIYGLKPTRGMISRRGALQTSASLDQVGVFARSRDDAAALVDAVSGFDASDSASFNRPRPSLLTGSREKAPLDPTLAWFDLPFNDRLVDDARAGLNEVLELLGDRVERIPAPKSFSTVVDAQLTVHLYEICQHLGEEFSRNWDRISAPLQAVIERGRQVSEAQYADAHALIAAAEAFFANFFIDYDAIIAPSASGEAPLISAGGTGDPVFCTIWTFAGLPCLSLPLLSGELGLPVGVQLVGSAETDDRLMRTANWLEDFLAQRAGED